MKDYGRGFMHGYIWGSASKGNNSEGCYIATCVYGSYDCPEVWTLRRFRDWKLKTNPLGRAFVAVYYAVSPRLVARFGHTNWLRNLMRVPLDGLVRGLNARGYESGPYRDLQQIHQK